MMGFAKTNPCFIFPLAFILCLMGKSPVTACLTFQEIPTEFDANKINITYSLRIGDEQLPKKWYQILLNVASDISFHSIMKIAARKDSNFEFSETEYSFGYYITEIAGLKEDLSTHQYWMLYRSPMPLLPEIVPEDELRSPVGVSDLIPNHGDNILFWYKTVNYQ